MEKAINFKDGNLMFLGESSSTSRRCIPLSLWEHPAPPPCSQCFEEATAFTEEPLRPFISLDRPVHEDSSTPQPTPSTFRPYKYTSGWTEHDNKEEDWSESEQLEALANIPTWPLHKERLPSLERIMGYDGRKVAPNKEVPTLSYEPFISPFEALECSDVLAEGIIFHHGLKPQTKVLPGCSLWTNHAALNRRFPFTIPLNKLEYISLGYRLALEQTQQERI